MKEKGGHNFNKRLNPVINYQYVIEKQLWEYRIIIKKERYYPFRGNPISQSS